MVSLQLARKLTVRLRRLPGTQPLVEAIRRRCVGLGVREVADFDGDLRIALDLREQAASEIFWFGYHRGGVVRCLNRLLGPGQVFFDVGARIGEITLVAAKRVGPSGAVYAFEAVATMQRKLAANVAANHLEQVRHLPFGVGAERGTRVVEARAGRYADDPAAAAGALRPAIPTQVAEVTTIDAVVSQYRLDRLDGIRLDVEGAELAALRGAFRTLGRFSPWLIVEASRAAFAARGFGPDDLARALHGYRLHRIDPDGGVAPLDVADFGEREALLCLPVMQG
ncbi:FkbM family methyltransferase [Methylobacterium sp. JK268]